MTKSELIKNVAKVTGLTQYDVDSVIEAFTVQIAQDLKQGGRTALPNLGFIKTSPTKARTCRNPLTGAAIQVPAGRKVVFTPTARLKADVNA